MLKTIQKGQINRGAKHFKNRDAIEKPRIGLHK